MSQDYKLVQEVVTDGDIPIKHYVNKVTGLNIFSAFIEWPIVKGDLVFATEAHDHDGLPHTLEHLVFMGSENYPYKGVLDTLANKCLASGTNAYTDTDNTTYQMCTAGEEGFLKLLPIFLDHLLFPTLTDEAYITEVHHVDGKGEDAGTVYCEMQARENNGEELLYYKMLSALYPGECGYSSNTGGLLHNLRKSTSNEKCRNYHKEFYHTKNLGVVVVGPVEPEKIFQVIKPIEDKVFERNLHKKEIERPWSTSVAPLDNSSHHRIQYISDTDDDGLVYIGFRGPEIADNYSTLVAINLLLDYLNSTAISPLQRTFVECEDPYCSSVSTSIIENSTSCFYLAFESVGKQKLDYVANTLYELLKNIVRGKEKFDMVRMKTILSRKIVRILSSAETSPHAVVSGAVMGHFLYGKPGELDQRCQEIPILQNLSKCQAEFWIDLIDKYMIGPDARHTCIVGEPSPTLMKTMAEAEQDRINKQKEELKNELQKLDERLQLAVETNSRPVPDSILNSIEVASPDKIRFHHIERVVLDNTTPFRFQYDLIKTNFVNIYLLMNTSNLAKYDRLYLPLMTELLFECPIMRAKQQVPYGEVVAELYSDTISYGSSIGLSSGALYSVGALSMLFGIMMQVEISKFEKAVEWFKELLYNSVFTKERIKTIATRMISEISQYKRSGGKVVSATMNALAYQSNSNQWAANFMRQQKFLKYLLKNLDSAPKELTRIRNIMAHPNNILVHLALNKDKINPSKVHEPWLKLIPEVTDKKQISLDSITDCCKLLNFAESPKAAVVGVGSVETNYLQQVVKSISSPMHPDLPAIYVQIQYLTQMEGSFWRHIRGLGLTYGYGLNISPSQGTLSFHLHKSTQVVAAYNKSREIIMNSMDEKFDEHLFASAKSSLMFELIKSEKSPLNKSMQSLVAHIRNLDINYNRDLIKKVSKVSQEDIKRVGPLYLKPLFEDSERRTVVCCNPSKIAELSEGLKAVGCQLQVISLEDEPLLNQYCD